MTAIPFDTLKYATDLKAAGFPVEQAEAQARALSEAMDAQRRDTLAEVERQLREVQAAQARNLADSDTRNGGALVRLEATMDRLEAKMDRGFAKIEGELVLLRWMFSAIVAGVIALVTKAFF
jgi:hypothetical protein